jgi:hypothetical protein
MHDVAPPPAAAVPGDDVVESTQTAIERRRMRPGMTRVADAVQAVRTSGLGAWIAPVIALVVVGASTFPVP